MRLGRRQFLQLGIAQGLVMGVQKATATETPPVAFIQRRTGPSVLQGATDETQTQFSIVYSRNVKLRAQARSAKGELISSADDESFEMGNHPDRVSKFYFNGLVPDTKYTLEILNDETGARIDRRQFQTLNTSKRDLKFALCSCMNEENHDPAIWQNMIAQKPDVLFFIGDSVYADTGAPEGGADPAHLWKRFCEARRTLEVYYSPVLVPIIATWDDHDFGLNDSNSTTYRYVSQSQKNFKIFFAQNPRFCNKLSNGPGVSSAFRWQKHLFLLMDDRSFRLPKKSGDRYAHWGREQENWMLDQIDKNAKTTWILNGSQIFPSMPFKETMSQDHAEQLQGALEQLRTQKTKVIFASGDVHYSEISQIEKDFLGYGTYELTSSSIHSRNIPGAPHIFPNKRRMAGTGKRNYLMVSLDSDSRSGKIQCDSMTADGTAVFSKTLAF
jgi:alkaline phosphatase D